MTRDHGLCCPKWYRFRYAGPCVKIRYPSSMSLRRNYVHYYPLNKMSRTCRPSSGITFAVSLGEGRRAESLLCARQRGSVREEAHGQKEIERINSRKRNIAPVV